MKSKIKFILATLLLIVVLQGCVKDNNPVIRMQDDKLLLSKVSGENISASWNNFDFTYDPALKAWDYLESYSYGSEHFGWGNYKPIEAVGFHNTGSWNFTYQNHVPDEIVDNSSPGKDQGYWKFYFNEKGQIIKTGLAFSVTAEPTQFEFYGYDDHGNLTDLVYGKEVDTPYFKVSYVYDNQDNLTQWQLLFPNGYTNTAATTGWTIFSSIANSSQAEKAMGKPVNEMFRHFIAKMKDGNPSAKNTFFKISPTRLTGDSNVIYQNYFTVSLTNDGKINPYHQQGGILFYVANRLYTIDLNDYFWPLQKSNTTRYEADLNPDFGVFRPKVSTFTYTYSKNGYPLTRHEEATDPDDVWFPVDYTADRQFQYISNH